jgi:glutathione synthase/RimK-type ligase-like ATP-grasp enzyme
MLSSTPPSLGILNAGPPAWAFEDFARRMSSVLWLDVVREPPECFLMLGWDQEEAQPPGRSFVARHAIDIAGDKRLIAERFAAHGVPMPETRLLTTWAEIAHVIDADADETWVLKYPTASGGSGHRLLRRDALEPKAWPRPFVLQRFVRMPRPEVYRLYAIAGETFGWNARRFSDDGPTCPWVAHARGARYVVLDEAPKDAVETARAALAATDLLDSFGCADLVHDGERWLALEVGTDGACGHVDRDVGDAALAHELDRRFAEAFWTWAAATPPWGARGWAAR